MIFEGISLLALWLEILVTFDGYACSRHSGLHIHRFLHKRMRLGERSEPDLLDFAANPPLWIDPPYTEPTNSKKKSMHVRC